jgi:hypothetical protein
MQETREQKLNVHEHDLTAREEALRKEKISLFAQQQEVAALMNTFLANKESMEARFRELLAKEREVNERSALLCVQLQKHEESACAMARERKAVLQSTETAHKEETDKLREELQIEAAKRRDSDMRVQHLETILEARTRDLEDATNKLGSMKTQQENIATEEEHRERDVAIRFELVLNKEKEVDAKAHELQQRELSLRDGQEKLERDRMNLHESKVWEENVLAEKIGAMEARERAIGLREEQVIQNEQSVAAQVAAVGTREKEVQQAEHRQKCEGIKLTSTKSKLEKEMAALRKAQVRCQVFAADVEQQNDLNKKREQDLVKREKLADETEIAIGPTNSTSAC